MGFIRAETSPAESLNFKKYISIHYLRKEKKFKPVFWSEKKKKISTLLTSFFSHSKEDHKT